MKQEHYNTRRWQHRSDSSLLRIWSEYIPLRSEDRQKRLEPDEDHDGQPQLHMRVVQWHNLELVDSNDGSHCGQSQSCRLNSPTRNNFRTGKNSPYVDTKMWNHPSWNDGNCERISTFHQNSISCRQELEYPGHSPMVQCIGMLINVRTRVCDRRKDNKRNLISCCGLCLRK